MHVVLPPKELLEILFPVIAPDPDTFTVTLRLNTKSTGYFCCFYFWVNWDKVGYYKNNYVQDEHSTFPSEEVKQKSLQKQTMDLAL